MERFKQSLADLLPKGYAWPRDSNSVLMTVLAGLAAAFEEHHDVVHATVRQWQPHQTSTRLAEWEAACGLPDACMGPSQTVNQRRDALLRRLRGPTLAHDDSSPSAPALIEQLCAEFGYQVTVRYNVPFRCGRDRVGQRLGRLDGVLQVLVFNEGERFRVGANRVGDRLVKRLGSIVDLECYLRRILPARFAISFTYI